MASIMTTKTFVIRWCTTRRSISKKLFSSNCIYHNARRNNNHRWFPIIIGNNSSSSASSPSYHYDNYRNINRNQHRWLSSVVTTSLDKDEQKDDDDEDENIDDLLLDIEDNDDNDNTELIVSILGPPNAGKSTLFNRLMCKVSNKAYKLNIEKRKYNRHFIGSSINNKLNKGRISLGKIGTKNKHAYNQKSHVGGAIVSSIPGTTRDRKECIGRIGTITFRLLDTAGIDGERITSLTGNENRGNDENNKKFLKKRKKIKKTSKGIIIGGSGSNNSIIGDENDDDIDTIVTKQMVQQTLQAAEQSDLVLLMFDSKVGVTYDLQETIRWLRKVSNPKKKKKSKKSKNKKTENNNEDNEENDNDNDNENKDENDNRLIKRKIILLANKLEGDSWQYNNSGIIENLYDISKLGFGEPIPISAEHGEGISDIGNIIQDMTYEKKYNYYAQLMKYKQQQQQQQDEVSSTITTVIDNSTIEEENDRERSNNNEDGAVDDDDGDDDDENNLSKETLERILGVEIDDNFDGRDSDDDDDDDSDGDYKNIDNYDGYGGSSSSSDDNDDEVTDDEDDEDDDDDDIIDDDTNTNIIDYENISDSDVTNIANEIRNNTGIINKNDESWREKLKDKPLQLAILGRQNVGKSTLVNSLLQQNRVITGSKPGLTRDAIAVQWKWNGRDVQIVDTAGIRKVTKRDNTNIIEDLSVQDALRAMKVADVAVLVLDAEAGVLQRQELAIADAVVKEGRALVVVANKMDLLLNKDYTATDYANAVQEQIHIRLPMLRYTPVVAMSSLTGENVHDLMPVVFNARDRWARKISTGTLNRWLHEVMYSFAPPLTKKSNGKRIQTRIKYVIQTKGRPPTFLLFCNVQQLPTSYIRFLMRNFQDTFEMYGMEVRFAIKQSSKNNPFTPGDGNNNYKKKRNWHSGGTSHGIGGKERRLKRLWKSLNTTGQKPKKLSTRRRKNRWY